jgi:hypothetical protein
LILPIGNHLALHAPSRQAGVRRRIRGCPMRWNHEDLAGKRMNARAKLPI